MGRYTSLAFVGFRPAISYYDATNGDLKFARSSAVDGGDGTWTTVITIDSVGNVGLDTSLAVVGGTPAISYYDGTNGDLKFWTLPSSREWSASDPGNSGIAPVQAAGVADGSVTGSSIAPGSITSANLASGAVTSTNLATGAVTSGSIADGTITAADLSGSIGLWEVSGGNIYRGSGRVGIGLNTPEARLHIRGANSNSPVDPAADLLIEDNGAIVQLNAEWGEEAGILFGRPTDARHGAITYNNGNGVGMGFNVSAANGGSAIERMRILSNGNVGIGTSTPVRSLHVSGDARIQGPAGSPFALEIFDGPDAGNERLTIGLAASSGHFGASVAGGDAVIRTVAGANLHLQSGSGAAALTVSDSNFVGIGTNTPTQARLVVSGGPAINGLNGPYLATTGGTFTPLSHGAHLMSIHATGGISTNDFFVASFDARIKEIVGRSESADDLATLGRIEITDYTYTDQIARGDRPHKKVIAQQVETVFPQAVTRRTDVVPDIYRAASIADGWIALETDLKVGERVKLIGKNEEGVHEVLEVAGGGFRTAFAPEGEEKIFVYGREVDDFLTVDYDAIAMLNVSATQELNRKIETQSGEIAEKNAKIADLEDRLAEMEERERKREALFTRMEELLESEARARTASAEVGRQE